MVKPVNRIRDDAAPGPAGRKGMKRLGSAFRDVLGGKFLTREKAVRLLPYFLFLAVMTMFYIANTYYAEKQEREIQALRESLKELRYEFITTRSELMKQSQQSEVARRLEAINIKESRVPPVKVIRKISDSHD
jgi:hypothetical protein